MDKANINEPLDLQEATRRDDVFKELSEIVDKLQNVSVFPSLLWVWCFDVIKDIFDNNQYVDVHGNEWHDECIPQGTSFKTIFDKFWEDTDTLGIDMDLGGEIIEETIRDWMRENNFLVALDNDGWLNEPNTFGNGVERGDDV